MGLTSLLKFRPAFGAGYDDFAFAPGDTDLLTTAGTLVDVMGFSVGQVSFPVIYFVFYFVLPGQEFLILGVARLNVAREHAEVAQDKQRENEHAHPVPLHHPFDHHENDREQQQRVVQLIAAVSACHKSAQKIHVILPFARRDQR